MKPKEESKLDKTRCALCIIITLYLIRGHSERSSRLLFSFAITLVLVVVTSRKGGLSELPGDSFYDDTKNAGGDEATR